MEVVDKHLILSVRTFLPYRIMFCASIFQCMKRRTKNQTPLRKSKTENHKPTSSSGELPVAPRNLRDDISSMAPSKRKKKTAAKHEDQIRSTIPIPEDIAIEILLKLPPESVFRFKCVSKQCDSIVSNQEFARTYMQQLVSTSSPLHIFKGMLYPYVSSPYVTGNDLSTKLSMDGKGLLPAPRVKRTNDFSRYADKEERNHLILASSCGLVLAVLDNTPRTRSNKLELCVSNPFTKQFALLPSLTCPLCSRWSIGLAAKVYESAYKVVLIQESANSGISEIRTFSSDTGIWSAVPGRIMCPTVIYRDFDRWFMNCSWAPDFCYNGILHWLDSDKRIIVTYDPYEKPCQFGQIKLPAVESPDIIKRSMNLIHLGDHEDVLRCCEVEYDNHTDRSLVVWRLVDYDKGKWCKEQRFVIHELCRVDNWLKECSQVVALDLLNQCRQVGAQDPLNHDAYGYLFAKGKGITAIDLRSGKEEFVDVSEVIKGVPPFSKRVQLVLFVANLWSSPLYHQKK
ncbi:hypothetical protein V2J09_002466 [Rumex salicifolius]